MTYAEKLQDPRWQKKRLEILERDNWACQNCGFSHVTLHVHHEKYSGNPWDAESWQLTTLCKDCHLIEEYIKNNYSGFHKITIERTPYRMFAIVGVTLDDPSLNKILIFSDGGMFLTELDPFEAVWLSDLSAKTYLTLRNG
jgi:hypothetical protein